MNLTQILRDLACERKHLINARADYDQWHALLGQRLRAERERLGISGKAMARRMGISSPSLRRFEGGVTPWPEKRISQFIDNLKKP